MVSSSVEEFKKQLQEANESISSSLELETLKEIVKIERQYHFNKGTSQSKFTKLREVIESKLRDVQ